MSFTSWLLAGGVLQSGFAYLFCRYNRLLAQGQTLANVLQFGPWPPDQLPRPSDYFAVSLVCLLWVGLYIALLRRIPVDNQCSRKQLLVAALFPVLLQVSAIALLPHQSIDILSYLGHGFIATQPSGNPYTLPDYSLDHTPYGTQLEHLGWLPVHGVSPYGPLWSHLEALIVRLAPTASAAVVLMKALLVFFNLASAVLLWKILAILHRPDKIKGIMLYLWNPLLLTQLALEGHNDSALIFFSLLALLLALRHRMASSFTAQVLGVLAKYITVLVAPAQLVYFWHQRTNTREFFRHLNRAALVSVPLAVLLFARWWAGSATFHGGADNFGDGWSDQNFAGLLIRWGGLLCFALYFASWTLRVRDGATLAEAFAIVSLAYVLFASPLFWPWYYALPLTFLGVLRPRNPGVVYLLATFVGMIVSPVDFASLTGVSFAWPLVGFTVDSQQANGVVAAVFLALTLKQTVGELARSVALALPYVKLARSGAFR